MKSGILALGLASAAALATVLLFIVPVTAAPDSAKDTSRAVSTTTAPGTASSATARAIFAGGCFWCMEGPFDKLNGVLSTTSGYTGGHTKNPSYRDVSAGSTGHTEAVEIVYDPNKVSYEKLLKVFWVNVDPTVNDRQFCDRGSQYRPGIFPVDQTQRSAAEMSLHKLTKTKPFSDPIKLEITDATQFYAAEDYHQNYYLKNPIRYRFYRTSCGRDARLKELWGEQADH